MFTGIVKTIGKIQDIHEDGKGIKARIDTNLEYPWQAGGSVAVNGICLTITDIQGATINCDISKETISKTNVNSWQKNSKVNIEPPLRVGDELGGHWLTGHVDGCGSVLSINKEANTFIFKSPPELMKYIAIKGSIGIDGASLTLADVKNEGFTIAIVPWTLNNTIFSHYVEGDLVNLEVDVLARYVERLNSPI